MSRKRSLKNLQDDIDEVEDVEHDDFIGIKSKNLKTITSFANIERRDLKLGTLLFGIIDHVTEKELTISLPGSNTVVISVENTLEESETIPVEFVQELKNKSLGDRFSVGQFVNGAVISNNKVKNNLTLKPSILNAGLNSNSKCLNVFGYVISGLIISKENHGFNIYTGIQGVRTVFMKVKESEIKEYHLGQILPVSINKYFKEKSLLTCTPIYDQNDNSKIGRKEILSIHEIKPGLMVECLIHAYGNANQKDQRNQTQSPNKKKKISDKVGVQPNTKVLQLKKVDKKHVTDQELESIQDFLQEDHSVQVSFCMGTMLGVIPDEHSIHPLSCFYPQQFESSLTTEAIRKSPKSRFVTARIIAVLSGADNKIILSTLAHNLNLTGYDQKAFNEIPIGSIISPSNLQIEHSTVVINSLSSITLYNSQSQKKAQNKISFLTRISDKWVSFFTNQFTKDYEKIDQTIKTQPFRVISHSRLENSFFVSFEQKVVQEKYFSSFDALPGQIVKAIVTEVKSWGISVRLSDYFSGRVYAEHLFNSSSSGSGSVIVPNLSSNSSKTMSKKQMDYVKKHYQIGRSYQFKVLRYEYSDNSWNPLLLLTAKHLLINDQLPVVRSVDESLKIGQKVTGYISRICFQSTQRCYSDTDFNQSVKNDYIIIRFYGEAYGSMSYKEYLDYYQFECLDGISKKPTIGEIVTVQIKSIDLVNKSLKLTFRMQNEEAEDPKISSDSPLNRQFLAQLKNLKYSFYDGIFDQNNINSKGFTLLGVTTQGLLFSKNLKDLVHVSKFSISDDKENSEKIYSLLGEVYRNSKSVSDLNSKISKLKFAPNTLSDSLSKQTLEMDLIGSFGSSTNIESSSITLNLNVKVAYLKHSILNGGGLFVKNLKNLADNNFCLGYINHIDHYGLLVSILSSEPLTGIVPRHLISSKVFFDSKEQLTRHFSIGETLLLKVIKLDETSRKITLSLKDLEDGTAFVREPVTTKTILKEKLRGLDRDEQVIQLLLNESLKLKEGRDLSVSGSSLVGMVLELSVQTEAGNDGVYMGTFDIKKTRKTIYFKLVLGDKGQDSKKKLSKTEVTKGLVLGGRYLHKPKSKSYIGEASSETKYVYYICCEDQIVANYSRVVENTEKTDSLKLKKRYTKFLESIVNETRFVKINCEEDIVYRTESFALSILMIKDDQDEKVPVIILYPNKSEEGGEEGNSIELNCVVLDQTINIPILMGVFYSSKESSFILKKEVNRKYNLGVNTQVQCKIVEHMKTYQGLIVQLPNKSFGKISVLELDDDRVDNPLNLEKFRVGRTIQGIIIKDFTNKSKKGRRVSLSCEKFSNLKYAILDFEVSSRISRIRDILDKNDELKEIESFSQVKVGSILSGYICNSGKEGVFVRVGRELVGRIKLRELTSGTITPEEASKKFFIGKFINQMVVVNVNKEEKKIDLSISKLDSDDIKLRLSQIETEERGETKQEDIDMEIEQGEGLGNKAKKMIQSLGDINEKLSFEDLYIGRVLTGVVTNISNKYGLFIRLNDLRDNLTALCKLSECLDSNSNSKTISSIFNVGDNVLCKVLKFNSKKRRVWVGIKPSYFSELKGEGLNSLNFGNKQFSEVEIDETVEVGGEEEEKDVDMAFELNDEELEYRESDQIDDIEENFLGKESLERTNKVSGLDEDKGQDYESRLEIKNLNRKQKVQRQLEQEHKIREEEEKGMRSHLNPSTIDDFERLLITHRDVSSLWIRYMSYYLDLGDLEKARMVAERSLKQISVKEEMERWNIWIAYINMEIVYGRSELFTNKGENNVSSLGVKEDGIPRNVRQILDRALMNITDQKKLYIQIFSSLRKHSKEEQGLALLEEGLKKFQSSRKLWLTYLTCLYESNNQGKARDEVIQKSLKSVSKHKLVRLITDIGRLEFEYGNINRGRTIFENLLEENSKRMDLWSQYFDILTKLCSNGSSKSQSSTADHIEMARSIFSSCLEKNFKPRSMKMIFTRWLSFEKQFGSLQSQKQVQDLAINYVNRFESNL
ncbi:RRP5 like involved in rRNA biogenesis with 7 S1 domains and 5 HAT repeats [Cryptosporidium sp. chipmunk genotype I]|uniref:RRP5 like involved in rRNA biogenesis with 7 S1 domains and 5 HAT repeats n=1 Tax=Cryptosporidium sp. chipmunk genotype I TaxID=1280935 RepID=UPI00351A0AC3|nr:RRP5 like involved in rRNA biogenesis with 7 S1 domains and 5 HAT repeats [Cryptosporidium sp. chipmunk genotype I]